MNAGQIYDTKQDNLLQERESVSASILPMFSNVDDLLSYLQTNDLDGLDSEFSYRTKCMVENSGALGADLNRWWVLTDVNWTCPCCKRSKPELVRLNKHNYLTCHLHEHHDHMEDTVKKAFIKVSSSLLDTKADSNAVRFVERISGAFRAYDPVIVCQDCNSADAAAKRLLGLSVDYSFSPDEVAEFINVIPNCAHTVNEDKAKDVWERVYQTYQKRIELIEYVVRLACTDSHWYKPTKLRSACVERSGNARIKTYGLESLGVQEGILHLYKPKKYETDASKWRWKSNNAVYGRPSDGDIRHIEGTAPQWNLVPDDWACPICQRPKRALIRKTNKGRWGFNLNLTKLIWHADFPYSYHQLPMCSDCGNAGLKIGEEACKNAGVIIPQSSSLVSPEEIKNSIQVSPNAKHSYNNEFIDVLIPTVEERIIARPPGYENKSMSC